MAEYLAATVETVMNRVFSPATEALMSEFSFQEELERLRKSASGVITFVHRAQADWLLRPHRHRGWLMKELLDLVSDADNVLNELSYEICRRKVESPKQQIESKVGLFAYRFSASNPTAFRSKMNKKLEGIIKKLEAFIEKAMDVWGVLIPRGEHAGENSDWICNIRNRNVIDFYDNAATEPPRKVLGRENDVAFLVEIMTMPTNEHILLLNLAGKGGIGKTTLARVIYRDREIRRHFDKRIWVSASGELATTSLLKRILETVTQRPAGDGADNLDELFQELEKELRGKRFLLVLDNVSINEDSDDLLLSYILDVEWTEGSWLLMTAQTLDLRSSPTIWHLVPSYHLTSLEDDCSVSLFKEYAFGSAESPEAHTDIENKVRFLRDRPLTAKVLGSMLRYKTEQEWPSIFKRLSDSWADKNQVLNLCFSQLPSSSLRKCFAYCSIFPKDHYMEKEQLVQLWVAEGFIEPYHGGTMDLEDIGHEFFHILLQWCLLYAAKKDEFGNVTHCKLHDVVYDFVHGLSQSISRYDDINLEDSSGIDNIPLLRHLTVHSLREVRSNLASKARNLSTLFIQSDVPDSLPDFKYLHVLNLSSANIEDLPSSTGRLIHLHYLDLCGTNIKYLPSSICKLYNLQTLRLLECLSLKELPKDLTNLINLRHLHLYHDEGFCMPPEMGRLTSLRTLLFYNLAQDKGHQIDEIGSLKNLGGKIVMRKLEHITSTEEAQSADLSGKPHIYKLEYQWTKNREGNDNDEKVLEGLQPHTALKSLTLRNYMSDGLPSWIMQMAVTINSRRDSLDGLMELRLINCRRCKEIPMLGQLPFLQYLEFKRLANVTCIGPSFYGIDPCGQCNIRSDRYEVITTVFPALKNLIIDSMPSLEQWMEPEVSQTTQLFPCLEKLTIQYCPELVAIPSRFPSLVEFRTNGLSNVSRLPEGFFHNNPNIDILSISTCSSLTSILPISFGSCTSLRELSIHGCQKLSDLPEELCSLSCLEILSIEECPDIKCLPNFLGDKRLSSLKHFKVAYCDSLTTLLSQGMTYSCTNLRSLRISHCPNLISTSLKLDHMTCLSSLWISNCLKLTRFPHKVRHLYSLTELRIGHFSESADSVALGVFLSHLGNLVTLYTVGLYGFPQWTSLPEELQGLRALRALYVDGFGIEAFPHWIDRFSYLEELGLYSCKKLKELPFEAMNSLTKFRRLTIFGCPLAKKRCLQYYGPGSKLSRHKFQLITD